MRIQYNQRWSIVRDFISLSFLGWEAWYEAVRGDQVVARSESFRDGPDADDYGWGKGAATKQALIDKLAGEGWEPVLDNGGNVCAMKRGY